MFNERATATAPNHPDWVSPHCLWDTVWRSESWQGTRVNFAWRPTAPLIRTYHVHERNMHGLVVHESDVRSLHTLYEYAKGEFRYEFDACGNPVSYIYRQFMGLPLSVTVTNFQEIEETTIFDYYKNEALKEVITPNGERFTYAYDSQGRLRESGVNGQAREYFSFNQWGGNRTLNWEDRTAQNWMQTMALREQNAQKQVLTRSWMDPLGRTAQSVVGLQAGPIFESLEYQGKTHHDKWNRVTSQEKVQAKTNVNTLSYDPNLPATLAAGFHYEGSAKSRVRRASKPGNNLWSNRVQETRYRIVSLAEFQQRTGATQAEIQQILPYNPNKTLLYETETTDEDGKQSWAWSDALGRGVATLAKTDFNNVSGLALSLFVYDAGGNLRKVIHPSKLETTHRYNVQGWKLVTRTPDAGESRYHYNQAGDLKYFQDENLKAESRFRVFDYDDKGRLKTESTAELGNAPLLNGYWDLHPLHYADSLNLPFYSIHSITDEAGQSFGIDNHSQVMNSAQMHEEFPLITFTRSHTKLIKRLHYDYAIDTNVTGTLPIDPLTLHPSMGPASQAQAHLIGRISAEQVYDDEGALIEQSLFSYDDEGRGTWMVKQFAKEGISAFNRGSAHTLTTLDYNLQGQPGRVRIDLNTNGTPDLEHHYRYDPFGRLHEVYINTDGLDRLVARYSYLLGTGQTNTVIYYGHSKDCPDPKEVDVLRYQYDHQDRFLAMQSRFFNYNLSYDGNSPGNVQHHRNWNGNINGWRALYKLQGQNIPHFTAATTYGFQYDDLNRLRAADASIPENPFPKTGPSYTPQLGFGVTIPTSNAKLYGDAGYDYDAAGNITGLWRYDYRDPGSVPTNLTHGTNWSYHYAAGTNQLTELKTNGATLVNIAYDANGNMTKDSRRGLSGFAYNERNLPTGYRKASSDSIRYRYGSGDQRVFKAETDGLQTWETFYLRDGGGRTVAIWDDRDTSWTFPVYGNSMVAEHRMHVADSSAQRTAPRKRRPPVLRRLKHAFLAVATAIFVQRASKEGEVDPQVVPALITPILADALERKRPNEPEPTESEDYRLKFFIQDHLGNTRVTHRPRVYLDSVSLVCKVEHEVLSVIDYYPYGKVLRSWHREGPERFMTTEHERDGESGLDYRGARYYDSDYARFLSLDPLAAEFAGWSPYNYVLGNPIVFVDPDGRCATGVDCDGGEHEPQKVAIPTVVITPLDGPGVGNDPVKKKKYNAMAMAIANLNSDNYLSSNPIWHGKGSGIATLNHWSLGDLEIALDAIGSSEVPFVSQTADLLAGGIAYLRGDEVGAGLSFASAIPLVGGYFNGAKWVKRANGVIDPSYLKYGDEVAELGSDVTVLFGRVDNQVSHTFRHTDALGLDRDLVSSAVETHLRRNTSKILDGKPLNQIIEVSGQRIQYTAFKLDNGTINVGRIHGVE